MSEGLTPAQRALLLQRVRPGNSDRSRSTAIPITGARVAPLSAEQEQIFDDCILRPKQPLYNEAVRIVRHGPTDVPALQAAFQVLLARHDIWRTGIRTRSGRVEQVVGQTPVAVPIVDLSSEPEADRRSLATKHLLRLAHPTYDLRHAGALLRPLLLRLSPEEHELCLAMHHLIFDGVSLYRIVLPELIQLYDAAAAGQPVQLARGLQYADYTLWQRSRIDAEVATQLPWWREQLRLDRPMQLSAQQPTRSATANGAVIGFSVPSALTSATRALAADSGVTFFSAVAAAFGRLLCALGAGPDVQFATVTDRRTRPELAGMVGYCLTPLVLRLNVDRQSEPAAAVQAAQRELLDAMAHAVPFGRLVRGLPAPSVEGAAPLFQSMLVLEPPAGFRHDSWELRLLDTDVVGAMGTTKADLHIELDERPEGHLAGRAFWNAGLFQPGFGDQVVVRFLAELATLVGQSSS